MIATLPTQSPAGPDRSGPAAIELVGVVKEPTSGSVFLRGVDVTGVAPNKRDVNMVFQSYAPCPHMSV